MHVVAIEGIAVRWIEWEIEIRSPTGRLRGL